MYTKQWWSKQTDEFKQAALRKGMPSPELKVLGEYSPYCMQCNTIGRMRLRPYGFACNNCRNEIGFNRRRVLDVRPRTSYAWSLMALFIENCKARVIGNVAMLCSSSLTGEDSPIPDDMIVSVVHKLPYELEFTQDGDVLAVATNRDLAGKGVGAERKFTLDIGRGITVVMGDRTRLFKDIDDLYVYIIKHLSVALREKLPEEPEVMAWFLPGYYERGFTGLNMFSYDNMPDGGLTAGFEALDGEAIASKYHTRVHSIIHAYLHDLDGYSKLPAKESPLWKAVV